MTTLSQSCGSAAASGLSPTFRRGAETTRFCPGPPPAPPSRPLLAAGSLRGANASAPPAGQRRRIPRAARGRAGPRGLSAPPTARPSPCAHAAGVACLSQRQLPEVEERRAEAEGIEGGAGRDAEASPTPGPLLAPGPPLRSRHLSGLRATDPTGARGHKPRSPPADSGAQRAALCARRGWAAAPPARAPQDRFSRGLSRREAWSSVRVPVWARAGVRVSAVRAQGRAGGVTACSGASVTFSALRSKSAALELIPSPPLPRPFSTHASPSFASISSDSQRDPSCGPGIFTDTLTHVSCVRLKGTMFVEKCNGELFHHPACSLDWISPTGKPHFRGLCICSFLLWVLKLDGGCFYFGGMGRRQESTEKSRLGCLISCPVTCHCPQPLSNSWAPFQ